MSTIIPGEQRRVEFRDRDGITTYPKTADSVQVYTIDWADVLGGETIDTSTWTASGVTMSGEGTTGTTVFVTVTGTDGYVINKTVTNTGKLHEKLMRFLGIEG